MLGSKATQAASFDSLRKFVLSLDHRELKFGARFMIQKYKAIPTNYVCIVLLRHLIDTYLKTTIKKEYNEDGLVLKTATGKLLYDEHPRKAMDRLDDVICKKMKAKYGKEIVRVLQQNRCEKKHILTVEPHVLASTFQYLSYK